MDRINRSMPSKAGVLANTLLLASCIVAAAPSWAARDAGQMIAQDKANRDVIARRQAALDVQRSPRASEAAASAAASAVLATTGTK